MNDLALVAVIGIALAFDFTNGFHDAANSIATVVAPLIGLALAFILMVVILQISARVHNVELLNRGFRKLQLVSAAAYSLGHGGNDAQKTMGVIFALLIATHKVSASGDVPLWV